MILQEQTRHPDVTMLPGHLCGESKPLNTGNMVEAHQRWLSLLAKEKQNQPQDQGIN